MCAGDIHKLHMEEDAGKTKNEHGQRLIDFNRCGVPLVEMVTGPDLRSADEAAQYLIRLRQLLRWLGISEADMEKGHLRCDANVSIRPVGADYLNPKPRSKTSTRLWRCAMPSKRGRAPDPRSRSRPAHPGLDAGMG
jgi:Asp-tRNA(Asn)/Glu-tRNA(Gln) amidotransferase B subunit